MAMSVYKSGQGYWTRMLSAIGAATLVLTATAWLWDEFSVIPQNTEYWQGGMAVLMLVSWFALLFWLFNRPRVADFLIATEAEMKKVNWPTKKEIIGSTWVVIAGTIMLAGLLWVVNLMFGAFFQLIGILESGTSGT